MSRALRCLNLSVLLTAAWGAGLTTAWAQPANDDFANPQPIFGDTGSIAGDNSGATKQTGEQDHAGNAGGASVWHSWVPQADGTVAFDTIGSDFDTLLAIYDELGNPVASNDDLDEAVFGSQDANGASGCTFNVIGGTLYYIAIDGFNANQGSYKLNWRRGGSRAAGEFEFTSAFYVGTENENFRPNDPGFNRDVAGILITVTRRNGSSGKVYVDYETQDDLLATFPALAGENYIPTSGTLVFEDHQMSASFVVSVINDGGSTEDEIPFTSFNVVLTDAYLDDAESPDLVPPVISLQRSQSMVFISDENPTPPNGGTIQFLRANYRRLEGVGTASIRVERVGGNISQAVTVNYRINFLGPPPNLLNTFRLSAGSDYATPSTEENGDYTVPGSVPASLTIPAFRTFADIDVVITNDSLVEFNEDIFITLDDTGTPASPSTRYVPPVLDDDGNVTTAATGYQIGAQSFATLTIMFDEYPAGAVDPNHNPDYTDTTNPPFNAAPGTDGSVYTVAVQPDGKTVLGGSFLTFNGVARSAIARMNADGSLDTSFLPGDGANSFITSLQLQQDGKIIIGGGFTSYHGVERKSIARLNENGTLDTSFDIGSGANGIVRAVVIQEDGKILIGGEFTEISGTNRNFIARLNDDGSIDETFNPGVGPNGAVFSISVDATGSILIGGDFTEVGGIPRKSIARLNADGTLDTNFNPGTGANGTVYTIVSQVGGKTVIGGSFTEVNTRQRNSIARLNSDGSVDTTFQSGKGANDTIHSIVIQPDGKMLVGGLFTAINGTRRMGVARLFADGPVDTSFLDTAYNQFAGLINTFDNLSVNQRNFALALALEPNGNVIVGGSFSKVGGGRGSLSVRPEQVFLDDRTRATYRNRNNIARLIGGATPGPGNIGFNQEVYSANEGASPFFVTLVRTNGNLGAVTAGFSLRTLPSGTGSAANDDFSLSPIYANPRWGSSWNRRAAADTRMQSDGFFGLNSVTQPFNNNGAEGHVFINLNDDSNIEVNESLVMELGRPKGARIRDGNFYFEAFGQTDPNQEFSLGGEHIPLGTALGRSTATFTILDNDTKNGDFTFLTTEVAVLENVGNAVVTVSRTNGSKGNVSVQFATADGTVPGFAAIRNLDYIQTNGTLSFAEGELTKTISVQILNDTLRENDEIFTIRLFNPTGGAKLGGQTNISVRIIDNDFAPGKLNFSSSTFQVIENAGVAVISVARTGGSVGSLSVEYSTLSGGTATLDEDYTATTGTLTWNHGDIAVKTFTVPILNDGLVEPVETVFLRLINTMVNGSQDTNAMGPQINATLEIVDDDSYGIFGFSSPTYFDNENCNSTVVTIVRNFGIAESVSMTCFITNGLEVTTEPVFFAPGELSKNVEIVIQNNPDQNPNLIISLGLGNPSPSVELSPATAKLTIIDDESVNEAPGSVDTTFDPPAGFNGFVYSLVLQPDGKILAGGDFTAVNNIPRNRIARLHNNGQTDTKFSSPAPNFGANGSVRAVLAQSNKQILVGGVFTQINGVPRNNIARLNFDGTTDITFLPGAGANNPIHALAETFVGTESKLLAAGNFTTFASQPRNGIVRLNEDGTVDPAFNPGLGINGTNGTIYSLAVQPDGKVLIGGDFVSFNGQFAPRIARLNANGSVDSSFNPALGPNDSVRAILVQTDGKIVIGGLFTTVNGVTLNRLARLNANGSVDNTFTPGVGANDSIFALALQPDGKIVAGGAFTQASGVTRNRLTRFNPDGTVDPKINFGDGANDVVASVAVQPDGKLVVAGGFTEFNGVSTPYIARLHGRSMGGTGRLEFSEPAYEVNENGTNAVITVRREGGTAQQGEALVSIDALTSDGTATAGVDYVATTANLVFPVGETRQTFTIPIIDDVFVESDETVFLTLTNSTADHPGNQTTAILTIKNDDSLISFSSATYNIAENQVGGNAVITIIRTGSAVGAVSVDFRTTTNGTAIEGLDYVGVTNTVFFSDGETNKTVLIPLIQDSEIEGDETVKLELSNAFGAILGEPTSATLTIVDDDFGPGKLSFLLSEYSVSETGIVATITVIRTNGSAGFVGVNYATVIGGTATANLDYVPTNGALSFGPGELSKSFFVRILDDTLPEGNETVNVAISNPTGGATISGSNTVPLIIIDNDVALSFSTPAYVVNEGESGVTITVRRDNGSNGIVTVFYETIDITAINNVDYIGKTNTPSTTNTLVFVDGETFKTFTVPILEDDLVEGDESFFVRLFGPVGAQLMVPSNAVVTIVDNDSTLSFSAAEYVVDEGGTNVMVTVVRTNTSVGVVTVNFSTSDGTATAGADYIATNGTLTFLEGEIAQTILIPIVNDASVEGDEEFTVHLSNPGNGAVLGQPSTTTVRIIDNDAGFRFSSPTYSVSESGVSATITVLRTTVTNTTVSVNYTTANGTATAGLDYVTSLGLLTFTNGETVKTFTVPIIDDTAIEGDETVLLTLLAPSPGSAIISPGAAVLSIIDNDGSLIVPAGSALISESGPVNGVIDASETVTLYFAFRNTVGANTANLVATLLPGGGITSPSGPQNYGVLRVGGASVSRPFSFTASGTSGQQIMATFQLQDGPFDLGTGTFTYTLGDTTRGFTNSAAIVINDSSSPPTPASPYPSTINVSGIVGAVTKVSVTLSNLSHSFSDDIDMLLVSPSGQKIMLMSDAGGGNAISNRVITFDDSAANFLPDSIAFSSGTYKPSDYNATADLLFPVPAPAGPYSSTLSVLNGSNPNGVWSLYVVDDTFFNNGSIANGWSLSIVASSALTPVTDLSIAMIDSPDPAATNNFLTYRLFVTNHGPSAATGIVVTNFLPQGVTYISNTCQCTNDANLLICPLPSLAKDGVHVFDIVVNPTVVGLITNVATIRGNQSDPNLLNNTASAVTTVDIPRADLAVTLSDFPDPVQINEELFYHIIVSNLGPAIARNVILTNTLPPGTEFSYAIPSQGTFETTATQIIFHLGDINPPPTEFGFGVVAAATEFPNAAEISLVVFPRIPGTITNIVSVGSPILDPFKANNAASVKSLVELPPMRLAPTTEGLSITWGTNAPGYIVESTADLSNPVWVPVTNSPVEIVNGQNRLIIDFSTESRFFRLSPQTP